MCLLDLKCAWEQVSTFQHILEVYRVRRSEKSKLRDIIHFQRKFHVSIYTKYIYGVKILRKCVLGM